MMSSLLHQLENNESILLMYLADELPPEDRVEVEALLQVDEGLRAELERLDGERHMMESGLASLDATLRLPTEERGVGRVGRMMRQWTADRMRPVEYASEETVRRFPWWGYPIATAAAVALLLLIWWQALPPTGEAPLPLAGWSLQSEGELDPELVILADSLAADAFAEEYAPIEEIERELAALQQVQMEF